MSSAIRSSVTRTSATSTPGTGRPTQIPVPGRESSSSLPMEATGSASVAPYGVKTCAPAGSIASTRRCTRGGTGAPGGDHAPQRGHRAAATADRVEQRGGAEHHRGAGVRRRRADPGGHDVGGPGRVHPRHHGGHPEQRPEQRERRERRQAHLARAEVVQLGDEAGLGEQLLLAVLDALGRPGAAAGEQHRGGGAGRALRRREGQPPAAVVLDPAERAAAGHRDPAGGHEHPCAGRPAQQPPGEVRLRRAQEGLRRGLSQTALDLVAADARVDEHRHGAQPQQRERQREEVLGRRHQQGGARPRRDPGVPQAGGDRVDPAVERGVRRRGPAAPERAGQHEGDPVRLGPGPLGEQAVEGRAAHAGASSRVATGTMRSAASSST